MRRACVAVLIILSFPSLLAAQGAQVLTQHNDNARTGANLDETQLNVSNVGSGELGFVFSLPVDGAVYAQPLYVPALTFPDGSVHNVVYIATMHNNVYAYDADTGKLLWEQTQKTLGAYVPQNFMPLSEATAGRTLTEEIAAFMQAQFKGCGPLAPVSNQRSLNIEGGYGITSTPVIDPTSNTLFVVAKTTVTNGFAYNLHALNLVTGVERAPSPVPISGQVPGTGVASKDGIMCQAGNLCFDPKMHLQRPALLLSNGTVYIAFGAHQETAPYHGWIFAYDAQSLQQKAAYSTTPNAEEGGLWQSGNGLAADASGNVYFMSGNGTFDGNHGGTDLGDSFVKLDPNLNLLDWFTPLDFSDMDSSDVDLGSAGPMLLQSSSAVVGGGKKGVFYLLDQNNMGHLENDTNAPLQKFQATQGVDNTIVDIVGSALVAAAAFAYVEAGFDFATGNAAGGALMTTLAVSLTIAADVAFSTNLCGIDYHHIHGSPVMWNSPKDGPLVYVWGERDYLRAYKFDPVKKRFPSTSPAYTSSMKDPDSGDPTQKFMPGGILSISANGSAAGTGIVWASLPQSGNAIAALTPGVLRAFDAENIGHELWCASAGTFAKFSAPTVANGKVYLATFDNQVNVYALNQKSSQSGWLGGYRTMSPPFVADGYAYFQGSDNKLFKVNINNPNGDNTWLGGYKTYSTPFVADGYVYFQGSDNKLFKVNVNNPNGDNTWLGGYKTNSTPFVSNGYVYFQGSDDKLFKVNVNNPNGDNTWLGGYKTYSTPFVADGYVYFQGSDNKLFKVNVNNPNGDNTWLGGYKVMSTPFVSNGYVYFQGSEQRLFKVNVNNPNGDNAWLGDIKTNSPPFVSGGYVFFQGTSNQLYRISTAGNGLASPGCGNNSTKSTPIVYGNGLFFQGTDNKLLEVGAYE
jgi:outer membrane protein assembly factor BamB